MKTLLITGGTGFLGRQAINYFKKEWKIVGVINKNTKVEKGIRVFPIDIAKKPGALVDLIRNEAPDAVLHLAASSNIDFCEKNEKEAYAINVIATKEIAKCCRDLDIYFLFTSTDLVFDGLNPPYSEEDQPNPINMYGLQKLDAEKYIIKNSKKYAIVRLPPMFSHSCSFLSDWINKLKKGESVHAFVDEYRSFTSVMDVILGLDLLLSKCVTGVWHIANQESCSRYDFAKKISDIWGLPSDTILKSSQKLFNENACAKRAGNVSLNCEKLYSLGYEPCGLNKSLLKAYEYDSRHQKDSHNFI